MRNLQSVVIALFVACLSGRAGAQREPVTLHGFVFDSLRGHPLRDAAVIISSNIPVIRTDEAGRFRADSVPPGVYDITAQHPLFDSIGLSGLTVHAVVRTGAREIALAVPSFETLWRRFWDRYLERSGDTEILEVAAPFVAFRGLVMANPLWYPALDEKLRRTMLELVRSVLAEERFDPAAANQYLGVQARG